LNINSNTTFKLAQIIVLVCKFLEKQSADIRQSIYSKISKEADFALTNFQRKSKKNETNIETLNLILALKKLDKSYLLSVKRIRELFGIENQSDFLKLNYFHIVTLLYYIDNNPTYGDLRKEIEQSVKDRFEKDEDPFSKSELTMLFFDFVCCPFVSDESKKTILKSTKYCAKNESNAVVKSVIKDISNHVKWFMDWDIEIDLEKVLKKKEWGSSY
jgi:hypothetical protein